MQINKKVINFQQIYTFISINVPTSFINKFFNKYTNNGIQLIFMQLLLIRNELNWRKVCYGSLFTFYAYIFHNTKLTLKYLCEFFRLDYYKLTATIEDVVL